eukprot:2110359-Rhodomonas_salina.2
MKSRLAAERGHDSQADGIDMRQGQSHSFCRGKRVRIGRPVLTHHHSAPFRGKGCREGQEVVARGDDCRIADGAGEVRGDKGTAKVRACGKGGVEDNDGGKMSVSTRSQWRNSCADVLIERSSMMDTALLRMGCQRSESIDALADYLVGPNEESLGVTAALSRRDPSRPDWRRRPNLPYRPASS